MVLDQTDHELVEIFQDPATGLRGVVALHSTTLGPAMGGLRIAAYDDIESMVADTLRLSRAMTMKNAAAGLPLGGGKAVLFDDGRWHLLRRERLVAFGRILDRLGGSYIAAEDSGTTAQDMEVIATVSDWVAGRPAEFGGRGDPAPYTACTVLAAIEAAARLHLGHQSMAGVRVGILGAGAVGSQLAQLLTEIEADVVVADIVADRALAVSASTGAAIMAPGSLLADGLDVLSPCSLGGVIDAVTATNLRCSIVAGAANNPLADEALASDMHESGILYVPDFIANCGGIIHVGAEALGLTPAESDELIASANRRSAELLASAAERGVSPLVLALELAEKQLSASRAPEAS